MASLTLALAVVCVAALSAESTRGIGVLALEGFGRVGIDVRVIACNSSVCAYGSTRYEFTW